MQFDLVATGTSVDDVRSTMTQAWSEGIASGVVQTILQGAAEAEPSACPFTAEPAEDNFGALELIAIAAAGRLAATIPERLLVRLFDEVVWPKLTARFGGSLKRTGDDE